MKIHIPFFYQDTSYTCGPTSLQMTLSYFGDFKSERWLAHKSRANIENGTKHNNMIATVLGEGYYCYVNSNSTMDEIEFYIKQGLPVIVDFTHPDDGIGHYSVVSAIGEKYITLNDPAVGMNERFSREKFESIWKDSITHSTRWIMVLSDKEFNIGKQYKPHTK